MENTQSATGLGSQSENALRHGESLVQYFVYGHLPPHLQATSKLFADIVEQIVSTVPQNSERTESLRKLLEAKDCAVRAKLFK